LVQKLQKAAFAIRKSIRKQLVSLRTDFRKPLGLIYAAFLIEFRAAFFLLVVIFVIFFFLIHIFATNPFPDVFLYLNAHKNPFPDTADSYSGTNSFPDAYNLST
jgi:hypothetical protein